MHTIRRWMTLLEQPRELLHLSSADLPPGTVLRPSGVNLLDGDIEDVLERARPATSPARNASVYMAADERSLENLTALNDPKLYRVRPEPSVVRLDHAWINRLWSLFAQHEGTPVKNFATLAARYARGYWSGKRAPAPSWHPRELPIWEYLAPRAVVISELESRE